VYVMTNTSAWGQISTFTVGDGREHSMMLSHDTDGAGHAPRSESRAVARTQPTFSISVRSGKGARPSHDEQRRVRPMVGMGGQARR
jgi:hypothetical protein